MSFHGQEVRSLFGTSKVVSRSDVTCSPKFERMLEKVCGMCDLQPANWKDATRAKGFAMATRDARLVRWLITAAEECAGREQTTLRTTIGPPVSQSFTSDWEAS